MCQMELARKQFRRCPELGSSAIKNSIYQLNPSKKSQLTLLNFVCLFRVRYVHIHSPHSCKLAFKRNRKQIIN